MQNTITAEDIISLAPCYSEEQVRAAVPREMTVLEFLRSEHIPARDRFWVIDELDLLDNAGKMYFCHRAVKGIIPFSEPRFRSPLTHIEMKALTAYTYYKLARMRHANDIELHVRGACAFAEKIYFFRDHMLNYISFSALADGIVGGCPQSISASVNETIEQIMLEAFAETWINLLERYKDDE